MSEQVFQSPAVTGKKVQRDITVDINDVMQVTISTRLPGAIHITNAWSNGRQLIINIEVSSSSKSLSDMI
jgi:hypothetical protein